MIFVVIFVFGAVLLASVWRWFVLPMRPSLRVLMYHKLHPSRRDALTLTPKQFEDQLVWLKETNYRFVRLAEVLATADAQENSFSDGRRAVLLTFDDGFLSNLTWAYPILVKHQIPAVVFLPTAFLGKSSSWELQNAEAILTPAQLKTMSPLLIEFGLHSHQHLNYGKLTTAQIRDDLSACIHTLQAAQVPFVPVFAYPFGGRPKTSKKTEELYGVFRELGIKMAFRIGNRINYWPLADRFQTQRLDIRGTDSMEDFKQKVRYGKLF